VGRKQMVWRVCWLSLCTGSCSTLLPHCGALLVQMPRTLAPLPLAHVAGVASNFCCSVVNICVAIQLPFFIAHRQLKLPVSTKPSACYDGLSWPSSVQHNVLMNDSCCLVTLVTAALWLRCM
jgi:hypothetical protein